MKLTETHKKHLRVIGYLVASWALALGTVYVVKDERLIGLAPAINYGLYVIGQELTKEKIDVAALQPKRKKRDR